MVKTWEQRCEEFDDMHVVSHNDIRIAMLDEIEELRAELAAARSCLMELRTRLHAMGRRPEECYEMSMIDAALAEEKNDGL